MYHIKAVEADTMAFCGAKTESLKTVEQAVMNGLHNVGLQMCPDCTLIVINVLSKPIEVPANE